jgi:hypothetical protein
VPRLVHPMNRPLSQKLSAPQLKFIGLSGEPTTNDHLRQWSTATGTNTVRKQSVVRNSPVAPDCPVCHRTVRCTTGAGESNGRLQRATGVAGTGLSGVSADRKPQPMARIVVGAINTPQPPPFKAFKLSTLHTQYKSK